MPKTKVLLIGAAGYATETATHQLISLGWNQLANLPNVRDFEIIIINLLDRPADDSVSAWTAFFAQLTPDTSNQILTHGGRIYVLGDPRFQVTLLAEDKIHTQTHPFLWWTGRSFGWDAATGTHVENLGNAGADIKEYLEHLHRWDYALINVHATGGNETLQQLAVNRTRGALAAAVTPSLHLFLLPQISLSSEATVLLALRLFAGIDAAPIAEPEWAARVVAPGQQRIDEQIGAVDQQMRQLAVQREALEAERETAHAVVRVLYARSAVLERAVRGLCRELGATVTEPIESNKEDGWIQFGSDEGVLEVKTTGAASFGEDGIRQLAEWILRGESNGKSYKGVFIGLCNAGQPPDRNASPFSSSFVRSITRLGGVALLTGDLYLAYELMKAGKLTPAEFWPTVFQTNGIYLSRTWP